MSPNSRFCLLNYIVQRKVSVKNSLSERPFSLTIFFGVTEGPTDGRTGDIKKFVLSMEFDTLVAHDKYAKVDYNFLGKELKKIHFRFEV